MSTTVSGSEGAPAPAEEFETRARRLDHARAAVDALPDDARAAVSELCAAQDAHLAAVLTTIVRRLRGDERGRELLYELVDDPEVHAALVKAGVVRPSVAMRAVQVLEGVAPYIRSHGGDVELVRIEDGIAYVRLTGACKSCSASSITLRRVVTDALLTNIPELVSVEDDRPAMSSGSDLLQITNSAPADPGLLQIAPLAVEHRSSP